MAARMPARIPVDLAIQMILEDEEPIMGFDSESDISDEEDPIEDPDYCPPGVVRPPRNAGLHRNQPYRVQQNEPLTGQSYLPARAEHQATIL